MAQSSPVGLWKTIDDKTHTERALVRITQADGVLSGRVEKVIASDAKPGEVCDKCTDDRKDKPIAGLEILRGVRQDTHDDGVWSGGTILDAANGSVYKVRLKPIDGGSKLEVRGYIGMPLLGRTQTWIRVE